MKRSWKIVHVGPRKSWIFCPQKIGNTAIIMQSTVPSEQMIILIHLAITNCTKVIAIYVQMTCSCMPLLCCVICIVAELCRKFICYNVLMFTLCHCNFVLPAVA